MSDVEKAVVRVSDAGAVVTAIPRARARSETTTLVFAVTLAVVLGVACGIWINSRMAASAETRRRAASASVPSDARAETPSVETKALEPPAEASKPAPVKTEPVATLKTEPTATAVEAHALKQPAPAAAEATPQPKPRARLAASFVSRESSEPEEKEQGRPSAPCALYASAASLNMSSGGSAFLVVGGPGETGPVTVTTQSWADIAVVREGRAANGWVKYAVKSTSNRPGLYMVRFNTSCGSQNIPVTVK